MCCYTYLHESANFCVKDALTMLCVWTMTRKQWKNSSSALISDFSRVSKSMAALWWLLTDNQPVWSTVYKYLSPESFSKHWAANHRSRGGSTPRQCSTTQWQIREGTGGMCFRFPYHLLASSNRKATCFSTLLPWKKQQMIADFFHPDQ